MSTILKRTRFNAGLSPEALAKTVGVSPQTIRNIEDGGQPHPATAKKIADHFGLKPTDLFPLGDLEPDTKDAA